MSTLETLSAQNVVGVVQIIFASFYKDFLGCGMFQVCFLFEYTALSRTMRFLLTASMSFNELIGTEPRRVLKSNF